MKIENSKILVTGGAGFIGSHLVDEFLDKNYYVIALDNLSNGSIDNLKQAYNNPKFKFIKGDILDKAVCQNTLKGIDIVFHLACLGVRHSLHSPYDNHRVNAEGTLNVLEAAMQNKVNKFFYISSSEIYGNVKSFPIKETDTPYPITVYGASKLAGEYYTNSYNKCYGLNTTVLRLFNNYGPRAHYKGDSGEVIPRTIVNIVYGKSPVIFGDGSISKDFLYVKETVKILAQLLNIEETSGKTFNIGTGEEITIKNLVETILKLIPEHKLNIEYLPPRPADVPRLWVDTSKLKGILDFRIKYSFEEGLTETIEFYKELMKTKDLISEVPIINWTK